MAHRSVSEMKKIIGSDKELQKKLFCRGYLLTDNGKIDTKGYPFWNNWKKHQFGIYSVFVHEDQHIYSASKDDTHVFLIGNAVNPFDMIYDEKKLVEIILGLYEPADMSRCLTYINKLTGSFFIGLIFGEELSFLTDPTEMLFSVQGIVDGCLYVSSHTQLIGDLCDLKTDDYINQLENYRFFYKYGVFFPGCLTQYKNIERVLTNHIYKYKNKTIIYKRFYPTKEIQECQTEDEYILLLEMVSNILKRTLECAAKKWSKPAISLTGGMDSKTTLSMVKGREDDFLLYSYITMDGDKIDADAAHKIANAVGATHTILNVSANDADFNKIEAYRTVLEHNIGDYKVNPNDVRKRLFFNNTAEFDVEIKSWISEIARANYYKKFGLKKMPYKLNARNMTAMYKVFLTERSLAKKTDAVFDDFINKSGFHNIPKGYDSSDMYLWEFRYSSWGGTVITCEHSFSYEIFIPYNNRCLLELMLKAPMKKRISDEFHEDLIEYNNKLISDTDITITNWNETKKRMYIEKMYFLLSSAFKNL